MKIFGSKPDLHPVPFRNTVFHQKPVRRAPPIATPTSAPYGLFVVLPFALGVGMTMYFTQSDQIAAVQAAPTPTEAPSAMASYTSPAPTEVMADAALAPAATLQDLVNLSVEQETVTRSQPLDLLTPAPTQDPAIATVLTGLTPNAAPAAAPQQDTQALEIAARAAERAEMLKKEKTAQHNLKLHMRMLREAMLAGVYSVETLESDGKRQLVLRPINVELSRKFMKDLLRAAEARGDMVFPQALSTSDGRVDLDTLLFNLVQNSLANDGTVDGAKAAREMTRRAFVASGQVTAQVTQDQSYVVQPGDSLAYISLKFYGSPGAYTRIYQANRSILRSPDQIRVGQKLVIPG